MLGENRQEGGQKTSSKAVSVVQTRRGDGLPRAGSHGCGGKQAGSRCILEVEPVGFVDILMTWGVSAYGSTERTVPINQEVNIRASGTLALRDKIEQSWEWETPKVSSSGMCIETF